MRGFQTNTSDDAGFEGFLPTFDTNTPGVARFEAGKTKLWTRGDQVIADHRLMLQKFLAHHHADSVLAVIFRAGVAFAVAIEAGERIGAAGLQDAAEYVLNHSLLEYRGCCYHAFGGVVPQAWSQSGLRVWFGLSGVTPGERVGVRIHRVSRAAQSAE